MELLVVTWAIRFATVAAIGAAALSIASGADLVDAVIRALIAALTFLLVASFLLNRLETPEQKVARMRARRAKAVKGGKGGAGRKANSSTRPEGDPAATRAIARSRSA